jgi:hypothetical protein
MSLNTPSSSYDIDFSKENYNYDDLQERLSKGNSLLKKHLTKECFEKYKNIKTQIGTSLHDIMKSGIAHPTSKIGIYA